MNLLLRGRPEIAIYPCNLFQPFRKLSSKLTLRAQNGYRKGAFSAAFWKCDHVPPRMARAEFFSARFLRRSFVDASKMQVDQSHRLISHASSFRLPAVYLFIFSDVRGRFIHSRKLSISNRIFYGFCKRKIDEKCYFSFRRSLTTQKK